MGVCLMVMVRVGGSRGSVGGVFSLLICVRLFRFTKQPEERESERRETNRKSERKGQKTNGVEGKTRPVAERKRNRLDGRGLGRGRKWDERSVREGQAVKVSV